MADRDTKSYYSPGWTMPSTLRGQWEHLISPTGILGLLGQGVRNIGVGLAKDFYRPFAFGVPRDPRKIVSNYNPNAVRQRRPAPVVDTASRPARPPSGSWGADIAKSANVGRELTQAEQDRGRYLGSSSARSIDRYGPGRLPSPVPQVSIKAPTGSNPKRPIPQLPTSSAALRAQKESGIPSLGFRPTPTERDIRSMRPDILTQGSMSRGQAGLAAMTIPRSMQGNQAEARFTPIDPVRSVDSLNPGRITTPLIKGAEKLSVPLVEGAEKLGTILGSAVTQLGISVEEADARLSSNVQPTDSRAEIDLKEAYTSAKSRVNRLVESASEFGENVAGEVEAKVRDVVNYFKPRTELEAMGAVDLSSPDVRTSTPIRTRQSVDAPPPIAPPVSAVTRSGDDWSNQPMSGVPRPLPRSSPDAEVGGGRAAARVIEPVSSVAPKPLKDTAALKSPKDDIREAAIYGGGATNISEARRLAEITGAEELNAGIEGEPTAEAVTPGDTVVEKQEKVKQGFLSDANMGMVEFGLRMAAAASEPGATALGAAAKAGVQMIDNEALKEAKDKDREFKESLQNSLIDARASEGKKDRESRLTMAQSEASSAFARQREQIRSQQEISGLKLTEQIRANKATEEYYLQVLADKSEGRKASKERHQRAYLSELVKIAGSFASADNIKLRAMDPADALAERMEILSSGMKSLMGSDLASGINPDLIAEYTRKQAKTDLGSNGDGDDGGTDSVEKILRARAEALRK